MSGVLYQALSSNKHCICGHNCVYLFRYSKPVIVKTSLERPSPYLFNRDDVKYPVIPFHLVSDIKLFYYFWCLLMTGGFFFLVSVHNHLNRYYVPGLFARCQQFGYAIFKRDIIVVLVTVRHILLCILVLIVSRCQKFLTVFASKNSENNVNIPMETDFML